MEVSLYPALTAGMKRNQEENQTIRMSLIGSTNHSWENRP